MTPDQQRRAIVTYAAVLLAAAALGGIAGAAFGAEAAVIVQKGRAFSQRDLRIVRGTAVHFRNEDVFLHQIFVDSPGFRYTSSEQEPGRTLDIRFPTAGLFNVRCEIHPKMVLAVTVE